MMCGGDRREANWRLVKSASGINQMKKSMPKKRAKLRRRKVTLTPADHGRLMSLDQFDGADAQEGRIYELNHGVIEVTDVAPPSHLMRLQEVRDRLIMYQLATPGVVHAITGRMECKVLVEQCQSERHPDISLYVTPMPTSKDVWSVWVPAIVVEIVSEESARRDYEQVSDEYLAFGIKEYWIVDPFKSRFTVMTRWRGTWKSKAFKPEQTYVTPILPQFTLELKPVFEAR
jgi:Uma2 family endonuclease